MRTKLTNQQSDDKKIRIILTSQNSIPIKKAIEEISKEVMKKNKELYRRLGNK